MTLCSTAVGRTSVASGLAVPGTVEKLPMTTLVAGLGRIVATPERLDVDEDDHCDASDLVLAVACLPTQSEVNAQAAMVFCLFVMINNTRVGLNPIAN